MPTPLCVVRVDWLMYGMIDGLPFMVIKRLTKVVPRNERELM